VVLVVGGSVGFSDGIGRIGLEDGTSVGSIVG